MPNRIIREGILSSEGVNVLNWAEEVFYRRLMSVVDDYGLYYATPKLLRAACYPLHIDKVSDSDIGKWLTACVEAALVRVYPASDGKRYLQVMKFGQQVRAKASKYPAPPLEGVADATQMHSRCIADAQPPPASAHLDVVVVGDVSVDEGENARERATSPDPPAGVLPETWAAWRRHKGKRLTADAVRLQTKHLAEWAAQGHDPNDIVERAVAGGWQGLRVPDKPPLGVSSLAEKRAANMAAITGQVKREREVFAERVGVSTVPALPGDLRESGDDDVGGRTAEGAYRDVG